MSSESVLACSCLARIGMNTLRSAMPPLTVDMRMDMSLVIGLKLCCSTLGGDLLGQEWLLLLDADLPLPGSASIFRAGLTAMQKK